MEFFIQERSTDLPIFTMAKQVFFVLLLVLLFTSLHVEARDGKFFFVSLHHSHHKKSHEKSGSLETPTPAPAPVAGGDIEFAPVPAAPESGNGFAPAPAPSSGTNYEFAPTPLESGIDAFSPAPAPSRGDIEFPPTPIESGNGYAPVPAPDTFESDNPYGLYGDVNDELSGERLTQYNTVESYNKNGNNGYANNYNNGYSRTVYNNNNNGYANNYNNGYSNTAYYNNNNNNGYSRAVNNNNNGYSNNGYSSTAYNSMGYSSNGYQSEKQGMSDTRFLENGKYYNPNQGNYNQNQGYESVRGSRNNEGFNGQNSKYEFDSMEEYERQQQGYSP